MSTYKKLLYVEKLNCVKAAKELGYPESVVTKLKEAKSENELSRIMVGARTKGEK